MLLQVPILAALSGFAVADGKADSFTPHQNTLPPLVSTRMPAASAIGLACAPNVSRLAASAPRCLHVSMYVRSTSLL